MRFLVTAGNTREKIDDVRDWGNIFTGNTGYRIACALSAAGDVDLLTSNRTHLAEVAAAQPGKHSIRGSPFGSHAELKGALDALMSRGKYDAIFMTAAVADYTPVGAFRVLQRTPTEVPGEERWLVRNAQAGKVKSTHPNIAILGEQTQKLVDLFRTEWKHTGLLVKFKLEVGISPEQLLLIGQQSRKASGANYLVANTLDMVSGDRAGAYLLGDAESEWIPRDQLPERMLRLVMESCR